MKIGEAGNFRRGAEATARRSYLTALFLALGDRDVVEQALRIAVGLVPSLTPDVARARIHELARSMEQPRAARAAASPRF